MKKKGRLDTTSIHDKAKPQRTPTPGAAQERPAGGGAASGAVGPVSEGQRNVVRIMQRFMGDLELALSKPENAKKAANALYDHHKNDKLDANFIMQSAQGFGATSAGGTSGTYDGLWGGNTKSSLERIKNFVVQTKIPGVLVQAGTGTRPYREMSDTDIIKAANGNIANFNRLFKELQLTVPEYGKPAETEKGGTGYRLDAVGPILTDEQAQRDPWSKPLGGVSVTVGDVNNFLRFFYLMQRLQYTDCLPLSSAEEPKKKESSEDKPDLEKIAKEIFSRSIWKAGQSLDEIVDPWGRQEKPSQPARQEEKIEGLCFNQISDFLRWFRGRSAAVYDQLYRAIEESRPHPLRPGTMVTSTDIAAAKAYRSAIHDRSKEWDFIKGRVEQLLREKGMENSPVVTIGILREVDSGLSSGKKPTSRPGAASARPGEGGSFTIPDYGMDPNKGPIWDFMKLEQISAKYSDDETGSIERLRELSSGDYLPVLDRREWGRSWVDIALRNIQGEDDTDRLLGFKEWAPLLRRVLQDIYRGWERKFGHEVADAVSRVQSRNLARWESTIRNKISQFERSSAKALSEAEIREGDKRTRGTPSRPPVAVVPEPERPGDAAERIKDRAEKIRARMELDELREARRRARKARKAERD